MRPDVRLRLSVKHSLDLVKSGLHSDSMNSHHDTNGPMSHGFIGDRIAAFPFLAFGL